MKVITSIIFLVVLAASFNCICQASEQEDVAMLENLRRMRVKQQGEEGAVRVQHFINQQAETGCTPVQQARQRLEEVNTEAEEEAAESENVNITAGHGELNVTDNHGTINSDVNIQIVKQGEDKGCL